MRRKAEMYHPTTQSWSEALLNTSRKRTSATTSKVVDWWPRTFVSSAKKRQVLHQSLTSQAKTAIRCSFTFHNIIFVIINALRSNYKPSCSLEWGNEREAIRQKMGLHGTVSRLVSIFLGKGKCLKENRIVESKGNIANLNRYKFRLGLRVK